MLNEPFRHRVSTITVISPQVTVFTRLRSHSRRDYHRGALATVSALWSLISASHAFSTTLVSISAIASRRRLKSL
jgi:hypothetical protein